MTADKQRFIDLYKRHYDAVLRYAWRRVGPDHAHDIVAETFTVAWRRLTELPGDAALPWLYGVARNLISNRARKIQRHGETADAFDGLHPVEPDHAETVGRRQDALAVLRKLSEGDREILRLIAWEGLSLAEAAVVLGCSTATA